MAEEILESNIQEEIDFIETNAEVIINNIISDVEEYTGEKLYDGDERKMLSQALGYILTDALIHINETGRENLLKYAMGNKLDSLGDLYGNNRLQPEYAKTTLKFTISITPTNDIIIPKGTRATPDGSVFFATDNDLIFSTGTKTLSQEVKATATEYGKAYNNFEVGSIKILVDGNPYVSKVENTTVSSGGHDIESDDEYRERLRLSPFSFSVAGPSNAYKMIALSVSNVIGDASVYSPSPGVVEIAVIKEGGVIPTQEDELLTQVLNACNDKERRPLTDKVQVIPAKGVSMEIQAQYYVDTENLSKLPGIMTAVEEYKTWQTEKIGRHINPDKLKNLMLNAGAYRVEITKPIYTELKENQVANITNTSVSYKTGTEVIES